MMISRTALLTMALLVLATSSAEAQTTGLLGARLLPLDAEALRLTVGFPDVEIAYHMPWDRDLELIPRAAFAFGRDLDTDVRTLTVGVDIRKPFRKWDSVELALLYGVGVGYRMEPIDATVLEAGWPGIVGTWSVKEDLAVDFGVQLQDTLYLSSNSVLELLFVAMGAFEVAVTPDFILMARLEMGPSFKFGKSVDRSDYHMRAGVGAAYVF